MKFLGKAIQFPDHSEATRDGLLAIGGDLSLERLIHGYANGIFPWYNDEEPILWWSPDPRFVLFPKDLKVSKSMKQFLRNTTYQITENTAFEQVITHCAAIKRDDQHGTWIGKSMIDAYINLHRAGFAKSVEVWDQNELVGGLYGIDLGNKVFCGESMFSLKSNSSKMAFIWLAQSNKYRLIDCQLHTKHLESLGAKNVSRQEFLKYLLA
jgi:leucyl/phenylalanyl-tRNA---protein transferase